MATPVTPQTLYADRLESAIGTLLLIMIAKDICALWTFTTSNCVCGVFFGFITARKEVTSL